MNQKQMKLSGKDIESLKQSAMDQGADNAAIISITDIILDPRVRFKCMIPKCYSSGACSHCPPHGYSLDDVRKMVSGFSSGIFFRVRVESSVIAAKGLADLIDTGEVDETIMSLGASYLSVFTTVSDLRQKAEQMGSSSTLGFAAGNCRDVLCFDQAFCQEFTRLKTCRNPGISAPSMESCGMDVFTMAARAGWDVYPIGGTCEPDSLPRGSLMGLVLVA
jgi:predicted metal-binding protein